MSEIRLNQVLASLLAFSLSAVGSINCPRFAAPSVFVRVKKYEISTIIDFKKAKISQGAQFPSTVLIFLLLAIDFTSSVREPI